MDIVKDKDDFIRRRRMVRDIIVWVFSVGVVVMDDDADIGMHVVF